MTQPLPLKSSTPARPSRMSLTQLVKGPQQQPMRVLLYGVEGVGKSTFGAEAPGAIFLGAEDGTALLDVTRFPAPETWADVLDAVRVLTNDAHEYRTLVLDSADWLEPLVWQHVCRQANAASIEEVGGGYGKGYTAALDHWRIFLAALEGLRRAKGMHVVTLAHSVIKAFKNPEGPDFERYELKLNQKAAGVLKEWHDAVLFANFEAYTHEDKRKRVRGVSTGARLIHTERKAAFDAKCRYSVPETLPLSWAEFEAAAKKGQAADPGELLADIESKAAELGGDLQKTILEFTKKAGGDVRALLAIRNRVTARLAERAETAAPAAQEKAS
jgi:hypothetical protein